MDNEEATVQDQEYAIVRSGGKQYTVRAGEALRVEKLAGEPGEQVVLGEVLFVKSGDQLHIGAPTVTGAVVKARILAQDKDRKVISFKKKKRKGFTWRRGHRQEKTSLAVEAIEVG